jgi:uncharacterized protein YukE
MAEYNCLDTGTFDAFIDKQDGFVREYEEIKAEYASIVRDLTAIWKGRGADAFKEDAAAVQTNIVGIGDMLQTMCDMLIDCREVFSECDQSIGKANKDATGNQS